MPRGNDKQAQDAQLHELADKFGEGVGNAEELIQANAAARTSDLAAISALPVLQKDTADLDLDKLEGPNGEYVIDASVRGSGRTKGTIVVVEDELGRTKKILIDKTEGAGPKGTRRSSHVAEVEADESSDASASDAPASKPAARGRS